MTSTFRTISAASLALLALTGGALVVGTSARADDDAAPPPAPRAQPSTCAGKAQMAMSSRARDSQVVAADTTTDVVGSRWKVRGPGKGKDTVLVTFSSFGVSGGVGEITSVALHRDGVRTSEGSKYYFYDNDYEQATVQFCAKLPRGRHTFTLQLTDTGTGTTTMYYPTVTYQRFG